MKRAVFLDRDGVVNQSAPRGQYILFKRDLKLIPGIVPLIRHFNQSGYLVIIVTNQQCVGKGLLRLGELGKLHSYILLELLAEGAVVDSIYYCPHLIEDFCKCRKPKPGMLVKAAESLNIDLSVSWMIGDSATDIEAGRAAGCKTILLLDGKDVEKNSREMAECHPDFVAHSLLDITGIVK